MRLQGGVRVEERAKILPGFERAQEQDVARGIARRTPPAGGPTGRSWRRNHDRALRNRQGLDDPVRRMARGGEDAVRALGVRSHQASIVAPDLGSGAVRMIEKVQVVNRDNPGCARGNEQRVSGVYHVEPPRDEALHARHPGAVPPPVQHPDGHPPVVHGDSRHVGGKTRIRAVLPRAREQVQPILWRGGAGQRRSQLVDVLANPGTVAQRGAVVEQDMHSPEG